MWADPGEWVGQYIYATGRYEESTVALMSRLLGPGDSVVDVGANVGYLTLLAARLVGPTGSVIAFEPLPQARAWLERNVALNRFAHVTVRGEAVADRSATVSLVVGPAHHTSTSSLMAPAHGGDRIEVACTRLDDAVPEKARVTLIKVDVEGAEHLVLLGATRVLGACAPHVIVELNGPEIARILAGYGYTGLDLEGRPLGPYTGQMNAYFTVAAAPPGVAGTRASDEC